MTLTSGDTPSDSDDLSAVVAHRVAELRRQRRWSLDALAKASGVSRAMLWQIEQGRSAPTLKVLARIADSMGVPLIELLHASHHRQAEVLLAANAKHLVSAGGGCISRALFPFDSAHTVELYEVELLPGSVEHAAAHPAGTVENLVVQTGQVEIGVGGQVYKLGAGDAIHFPADQAHSYRNLGEQSALFYLVMSFSSELNYR